MMYYMGLYHNICVLLPLEHELRRNINTKALENILFLLVYSSF
jgi:hypothetical protein